MSYLFAASRSAQDVFEDLLENDRKPIFRHKETEYLSAQKSTKKDKEILFYLPIVMERIVMAIQSGLDILPAIKTIVQIESERLGSREPIDPVSKILKIALSKAESGICFEDSLKQVGKEVTSIPLKHAFIHLALAHKQGGPLVTPLRELSDATQEYFQDSLEEDIAKMPVRATLPLLLTFAGLIVCFVTIPIMQIGELSSKNSIQEQHHATQM